MVVEQYAQYSVADHVHGGLCWQCCRLGSCCPFERQELTDDGSAASSSHSSLKMDSVVNQWSLGRQAMPTHSCCG